MFKLFVVIDWKVATMCAKQYDCIWISLRKYGQNIIRSKFILIERSL